MKARIAALMWAFKLSQAYTYLAVAVAVQRQQEAGAGLDAGLVPITVPELLRLLRDTSTGHDGRPRRPLLRSAIADFYDSANRGGKPEAPRCRTTEQTKLEHVSHGEGAGT